MSLGGRANPRHPQQGFAGLVVSQEVVTFSDTEEGEDLRTFVQLVQQHGERSLWKAVKSVESNETEADIILSTAHKSKGREWDSVRLAQDFLSSQLGPDSPTAEAEVRLFYVAMTRAGQERRYSRAASSRFPPGFPLVPELTPLPSEAIFGKITMSAFEGTPLDVSLRDCGINSFIIVGVAMEIGTDRWRLEPTRHRRMRLSDPEKQAHAAKRSAASLCAVA
jgi:hypothetical protein